MSDRTLAFNVESFRRHLLSRVEIPPEMVSKALMKLNEKMDARITKFFTYRGRIVQKVDVVDHGTQLAAATETLDIAGLNVREAREPSQSTGIAIEIDPSSGVMRLVIGVKGGDSLEKPVQEADGIASDGTHGVVPLPPTEVGALVNPSTAEHPTPETLDVTDFTVLDNSEELVERPRRARVPSSVWKILSDEEV